MEYYTLDFRLAVQMHAHQVATHPDELEAVPNYDKRKRSPSVEETRSVEGTPSVEEASSEEEGSKGKARGRKPRTRSAKRLRGTEKAEKAGGSA